MPSEVTATVSSASAATAFPIGALPSSHDPLGMHPLDRATAASGEGRQASTIPGAGLASAPADDSAERLSAASNAWRFGSGGDAAIVGALPAEGFEGYKGAGRLASSDIELAPALSCSRPVEFCALAGTVS